MHPSKFLSDSWGWSGPASPRTRTAGRSGRRPVGQAAGRAESIVNFILQPLLVGVRGIRCRRLHNFSPWIYDNHNVDAADNNLIRLNWILARYVWPDVCSLFELSTTTPLSFRLSNTVCCSSLSSKFTRPSSPGGGERAFRRLVAHVGLHHVPNFPAIVSVAAPLHTHSHVC